MQNTTLGTLVRRLRDPRTESAQFRHTLEEVGYLLGAQIADTLATEPVKVSTTMQAAAKHHKLKEQPVLVCLLRAGIPLYQGMQKAFPEAEAGFIGTARDEETLKSKISYVALPRVKKRKIILIDTMIATGGSIIDAGRMIREHNTAEILVVGALASQQGYDRVHKEGLRVYAAAIDPHLNNKGFIVPGLGDAGDRCYGEKDTAAGTAH